MAILGNGYKYDRRPRESLFVIFFKTLFSLRTVVVVGGVNVS